MTEAGSNSSNRFLDVKLEPTKRLSPLHGYQLKPLVSIEEAVKPLEPIIYNIQGNVWTATGNCGESNDVLDQNELAAIYLYTMDCLYSELNSALRNEDRKGLVPYFSYLKLLLTALWKLPNTSGTVWRGMKGNMVKDYPQGKTFNWWGFTSCTEAIDVLKSPIFLGDTGPRTLFSIECFNGKMIKNYSKIRSEQEVLLLPCSYFEVIGSLSQGKDLSIIHLRQIKPPVVLLPPPFELSIEPKSAQMIARNRPVNTAVVETISNDMNKLSLNPKISKILSLNLNALNTAPQLIVPIKKSEGGGMAANDEYFIYCPSRKLALIDMNGTEKLVLKRQGMVGDICWSSYLNQFLILNYLGTLLYALDISSKSLKDLLTLKKTFRAYGCTCYETTIYIISTMKDEPLIEEYCLLDWSLKRSFIPPKSNKHQSISNIRFSSNGIHIGTITYDHSDSNYKHCYFELRRANDFHILQTVTLGTDSYTPISFPNGQFCIHAKYVRKFFLIDSTGQLKQTIDYDAKFIWAAALINNRRLVVEVGDNDSFRFYNLDSD